MEIDQFQMNREIQKCARDEFRGSTDLAQLKKAKQRERKYGERQISGVAMREVIPDGFLICSCVMVG